MAVVENKSTEEGDVILIKAEVPIVGLIGLTDFIDDTSGEDGDTSFTKQFRYSNDGINFSDWIALTQDNLQDVEVNSTDNFFIEYKYIHSGNDDELTFNSVTTEGNYIEPDCGNAYNNSIFKQFFGCNDTEVLSWCVNVTEKCFKQNIVPRFMTRGTGLDIVADRDYIDFWRTVACLFAFIVVMGRRLVNFKGDPELLLEFVTQRAMYVCNDEQYDGLYYLLTNYYREIAKRGTYNIIKTSDESGLPIDGELLRLICYKVQDEFIFNYIDNSKINWNINNASPLYKGNGNQKNCIKGYEQSKDVTDLDKYALLNRDYQKIITDGDKEVLQIDNVLDGSESISQSVSESGSEIVLDDDIGIGFEDFNKLILVDPSVNYEISFYIRQTNPQNFINFGCYSYDINNNQIDTQSITGLGSTNFFFKDGKLNRDDKYYFVRGIIYNKDKTGLSESDARLNIGYGQQLRFKNDNVAKIQPILTMDYSDSGELRIWDFKIRPVSTGFGRGFVQAGNFIDAWLRNRNGTYSNNQSTEIMRKYLLPYNSLFKPTWLPSREIENIGDFSSNDFNNDFG